MNEPKPETDLTALFVALMFAVLVGEIVGCVGGGICGYHTGYESGFHAGSVDRPLPEKPWAYVDVPPAATDPDPQPDPKPSSIWPKRPPRGKPVIIQSEQPQ